MALNANAGACSNGWLRLLQCLQLRLLVVIDYHLCSRAGNSQHKSMQWLQLPHVFQFKADCFVCIETEGRCIVPESGV